MLMSDRKQGDPMAHETMFESRESDNQKKTRKVPNAPNKENTDQSDLTRAKDVLYQVSKSRMRRARIGLVASSILCIAGIIVLYLALPPLALKTTPSATTESFTATFTQADASLGGYLLIGVIALSMIGALVLYWVGVFKDLR